MNDNTPTTLCCTAFVFTNSIAAFYPRRIGFKNYQDAREELDVSYDSSYSLTNQTKEELQ